MNITWKYLLYLPHTFCKHFFLIIFWSRSVFFSLSPTQSWMVFVSLVVLNRLCFIQCCCMTSQSPAPMLSPFSFKFVNDFFSMSQNSNMYSLLHFYWEASKKLFHLSCTPHYIALWNILSIIYSLLTVLNHLLRFVFHRWHNQLKRLTQLCYLWYNPCVTFLFTHPSPAFTLIASPVVFLFVYFLSMSLAIHL